MLPEPQLVLLASLLALFGLAAGLLGRALVGGQALTAHWPRLLLPALAALAAGLSPSAAPVALSIDVLLLFLLIALAAADAERFILPNVLTYGLLALGLAVAWAGIGQVGTLEAIMGAAIGLASFVIVAAVYRRLRGRDGLGLGDAKLAAAGGAWIGWTGLPGAILIAALAGLAFALLASLFQRRPIRAETRLPFGVFITLGIWIVWRFGPLSFDWLPLYPHG